MSQRVRDRIRRGIYARPYVAPMGDTTPDPFAFTDVNNAAPSSLVTSDVITVSGIDTATPAGISTSGGAGEYSKNGGGWTASLGSVVNGDTVQLRVTASATPGALVTATLTIGSVSGQFRVTTDASAGGGDLDLSKDGNINLEVIL
jgi:hypothetical protein